MIFGFAAILLVKTFIISNSINARLLGDRLPAIELPHLKLPALFGLTPTIPDLSENRLLLQAIKLRVHNIAVRNSNLRIASTSITIASRSGSWIVTAGVGGGDNTEPAIAGGLDITVVGVVLFTCHDEFL